LTAIEGPDQLVIFPTPSSFRVTSLPVPESSQTEDSDGQGLLLIRRLSADTAAVANNSPPPLECNLRASQNSNISENIVFAAVDANSNVSPRPTSRCDIGASSSPVRQHSQVDQGSLPSASFGDDDGSLCFENEAADELVASSQAVQRPSPSLADVALLEERLARDLLLTVEQIASLL
jgi:hypothetical protein